MYCTYLGDHIEDKTLDADALAEKETDRNRGVEISPGDPGEDVPATAASSRTHPRAARVCSRLRREFSGELLLRRRQTIVE